MNNKELADQIITRARQRIEAGWTQWQQTDRSTNSVCLTRAIDEAADEVQAQLPEMPAIEVATGSGLGNIHQAVAEVHARANKAIAELNPGTPIKGSVIAWNDQPTTSQADVIAVLNRALEPAR